MAAVVESEGNSENMKSRKPKTKPEPSDLASFKTWWEPFMTDPKTGASIGGQPEAWRWWARSRENGKWERRQCGERAGRAFSCGVYHDLWRQWKIEGDPIGQWIEIWDEDQEGQPITRTHQEAFVSNCLPIGEQAAKLAEFYKRIGDKHYVA